MISVEGQAKDEGVAQNEATALIAAQRKRGARRTIFYGQIVAFLFGLALLVYVINRIGLQPIFDALTQIGFGLFVILAVSGLRHFIRAIALRTAVPHEHRHFSLGQAFSARLGGMARQRPR